MVTNNTNIYCIMASVSSELIFNTLILCEASIISLLESEREEGEGDDLGCASSGAAEDTVTDDEDDDDDDDDDDDADDDEDDDDDDDHDTRLANRLAMLDKIGK